MQDNRSEWKRFQTPRIALVGHRGQPLNRVGGTWPLDPPYQSRALVLVLGLLLMSAAGCSKQAIQATVFEPVTGSAGAATPEELARLYEETHRQRDIERFCEALDSHLVQLRDWAPRSGHTREELGMLFDFELERVRLERMPPNTPAENAVAWYLNRTGDGGQSCSLSVVGLAAAGKLILVGRWPGGERLELDPGLAVVEAPTADGIRYLVDRNSAILRLPGALLAEAREERSDGSNHFRAVPLGTDFETAFALPGTRKKSRYSKTWDEAVGDLARLRHQVELAAEN